MNVNKVFIAGNLTRDPQLKYLANQTAVCEFGVAVNRKYTSNGEQREDVTFVDVSAFGKTAETISQHLAKGKPIFIEGRLKFDSWDDKTSGAKRSKLSIIADNFQFVGGRNDDEQKAPDDSGDQRRPFGRPPSSKGKVPADAMSGKQEFDDDSIPFIWEGRNQQSI